MIERMRFVQAARARQVAFSQLCELFDIPRKTGYKWLARADAGEPLTDRSRRPHSNKNAVDEEVVLRLTRLRKAHPTWGARKLIGWLNEFEPDKWDLPAASTITELLKRHDLVRPRHRRKRLPPSTAPLAHAKHPNDVWAIDFKGDFRLADGTRCYPLTVTDSCSRMLLCCRHQFAPELDLVQQNLLRTFRRWGLPRWMRSDNGPPFGTMKTGPLSRLSAWLIKLGVMPEYTDMASPHQNGRHERMHGTLKAETARPPADNATAQQRRFDRFRQEFNFQRPHESLGQRPPAKLHRRSTRELPRRIQDPVYPQTYERRRLNSKGYLSWRGDPIYLSDALRGELVALNETDDGLWEVYFGPLVIARMHEAFDGLIARPKRPKVSPMSPV